MAEIPEHEGRVSDWASEDGPPLRTSRSGSNIRPQALSPGPSLTWAARFRRVTSSEWHLRLVRANWSAVTKVGRYSVVIAETAIRSSA